MSVTSTPAGPHPTLREKLTDFVALTKPSITRMCLITTAGGLWLAAPPESASQWWTALWAIVGTAAAVGSANALNMWWERLPDKKMARTRNRPLAAERMPSQHALLFGIILGIVSLGILAAGTNWLTACLGGFALGSYVGIYTPLKYKTPLALVIGAVPGAMPPLMGWTAATNSLDPAGLALFATLLVWQMPHFLAISIYRKQDYARAGIRIVPVVRGDEVAKRQAIAWATALVPISMMLTPMGITGSLYLIVATVSSVAFLAVTVSGLWAQNPSRWARKVFLGSLIHLPLITVAIALDAML